MWLLNTTTFKLQFFVGDIPEYVILSHTWGEEEVTFDDISKSHASNMAGYNKIIGCCRLAVNDGFEWAWIDTCCIDKRSSAELSEAINSMYKWYWEAAICYAYLPDVCLEHISWRKQVEASRWFTRGWTLQELLAPEVVEFYDREWQMLGTKSKLIEPIKAATNIEPTYISHREAIRGACIATRFSWAAMRQTTREEDQAYCLLGLVGVNMPMLYGEGKRAFYRLQLQIIAQTNEHSILAWQPLPDDWQSTAVLAPSPHYFAQSAQVRPMIARRTREASTHEVTNSGLRITLPCISIGERMIALIDCEREMPPTRVGIWLERLDNGTYQRQPGSQLAVLGKEEDEEAAPLNLHLKIDNGHGEARSQKASSLVFGSILSDDGYYASNVVIFTKQTATIPEKGGFDRCSEYLRNLVVQEGQAAYIALAYGHGSRRQGAVVGLRNSRPAMRFVDFGVDRIVLEGMNLESLGIWDVAGDFHQILLDRYGIFQMTAKKARMKGQTSCTWHVTIRIYECRCGSTSSSANDCICDVNNHHFRVQELLADEHYVCLCEDCRDPQRKPLSNLEMVRRRKFMSRDMTKTMEYTTRARTYENPGCIVLPHVSRETGNILPEEVLFRQEP